MRNLHFVSSIEVETVLQGGNAMSFYTYYYGPGRMDEFCVMLWEGDVKLRKLSINRLEFGGHYV